MKFTHSSIIQISIMVAFLALMLSACKPDPVDPDDPNAGFLASEVDALGDIDLGGFTVPSSYDIDGALAPGAYNGQIRRIAQLKEIVDSSRNEPIKWDIANAMEVGGLDGVFRSAAAMNTATSSSDLRSKIDELNYDNGNTSVADAFAALADEFVASTQANYTVTASNGTAGMIATGDKKRHVSAKGLEYAQILEKGMYGPLLYDQMVDDYLRPGQAGIDNDKGNNESAVDNYSSNGTDRQHRWDEAFGYFGADPATYPNLGNTSTGDGIFMSNYTFDFSDETETAFGINLAQKAMDAFILGRSALKAGQGFGPGDESTNEAVFNAARADIKLYVEAGLAAAAFHYLNDAIADITDEDKLHHLSEALGFIYSLSFNSEGRLTASEAHDVLKALGWSSSDASLNGIYEINLWEVTDAQMESARSILNESFPGFSDIPF
ncbi:MAG: DUF4856 domain-containing protein [Bacteroidota bacterium]